METCELCQKQSLYKEVEPLNTTWTNTIFNKVGVDIVHMPNGVGQKHYLVAARDDSLTGLKLGLCIRNQQRKSLDSCGRR